MVPTYIAYIGSKMTYICSDSKVELQKIKMQVSKGSIYMTGRETLTMNPVSTEAKINA